MASTTKNVVTGKPNTSGGGVLFAPTGTALPADESTAPIAAYVPLGLISDDGLSETIDRSTDTIKAWGGDTVKVVQTDFSVTYKFALIETVNSDVLKAVFGDANVTTVAATSSTGSKSTVKLNSTQLPHKAWIFDVRDDGGAKIRVVVPDGQVTAVDDITYKDSEAAGYSVTVQAFYNSALNGVAVKYINDAVTTAG